ncbi:hypothetical protein E3V36_05525 [Candidatus Marinimicrobia bacterium MT.SAG.2]|nr:hypothetical protein E3V36_05525 [Candidatus Marinimicrobia bacterium MT.SAG.2]
MKSMSLEYICTAVIFCGGKATRLRPILRGAPKALIKLNEQPYLDGLLKLLFRMGVRFVFLCISPPTIIIANSVGDGHRYGLTVKYTIDNGEVENAGALWNALPDLHTPLLLCINGDTIVDLNLPNLINAHIRSGAVATLVGSTRNNQPHPGAIEVSLDGWVNDMHEAAQDRGEQVIVAPSSARLSNSGVYVFDRTEIKNNWKPEHRTGKMEQGLLPYLASKRLLWAYNNGNRFLLDLGEPERLEEALLNLQRISGFFPG